MGRSAALPPFVWRDTITSAGESDRQVLPFQLPTREFDEAEVNQPNAPPFHRAGGELSARKLEGQAPGFSYGVVD